MFAPTLLLSITASAVGQQLIRDVWDTTQLPPYQPVTIAAHAISALTAIGIAAQAATGDIVAAAERHPELRLLAVEALSTIGGRDQQPFLLPMLASDDVQLRLAAADVLARIGGHERACLAVLATPLRGHDYDTTFPAVQLIATLGPAARDFTDELRYLHLDWPAIDPDTIAGFQVQSLLATTNAALSSIDELYDDPMTIARRLVRGTDATRVREELDLMRSDHAATPHWFGSWPALCHQLLRWSAQADDDTRTALEPLLAEARSVLASSWTWGAEPAADAAEADIDKLWNALCSSSPAIEVCGNNDPERWYRALADITAAGARHAPAFAAQLDGDDPFRAASALAAIGADAVPLLRQTLSR